jgi:phosphoserine aminotransferase
MIERIYNFGAGPAILPREVLQKTSQAVIDYRGSGIGIMECSHRSAEFAEILATADANLRSLLEVPEDYSTILLRKCQADPKREARWEKSQARSPC